MVSVYEKVDPSGYDQCLAVAPDDDFIEEFESSCGFLIGHLLGFCRQAFGTDPLVELVKPLCGDWGLMGVAKQGWADAGQMCKGVGENFTELDVNTVDVWDGEAAEAFRSRMVQLGQNYATYAEGCDLIGELTGSLIEVAKSAALGIATLVSFISDILERLIIEASVPVVGWLVGAADIAIHIKSFWDRFDKAVKLIRRVLDTIDRFIDAIYAVVNIMHVIKLTLNGISGGLAAYNGSRMDEAAQNQFGV
ncbi:hypothetical protein ASC58_15620 [Phycicoccus sp. Root101]|nr:hypothetical protein ASC58_15620 [Phycicoccus sp. Root101]